MLWTAMAALQPVSLIPILNSSRALALQRPRSLPNPPLPLLIPCPSLRFNRNRGNENWCWFPPSIQRSPRVFSSSLVSDSQEGELHSAPGEPAISDSSPGARIPPWIQGSPTVFSPSLASDSQGASHSAPGDPAIFDSGSGAQIRGFSTVFSPSLASDSQEGVLHCGLGDARISDFGYGARNGGGRMGAAAILGLLLPLVAGAWVFPEASSAGETELGFSNVMTFAGAEPSNALSLPTWIIHVASVAEWVTAMILVWKYGNTKGNSAWKGLTWGMVPLLGGALCACTWHFFYNAESLAVLVELQAFLTVIGNFTLWAASYRIWKLAEQKITVD